MNYLVVMLNQINHEEIPDGVIIPEITITFDRKGETHQLKLSNLPVQSGSISFPLSPTLSDYNTYGINFSTCDTILNIILPPQVWVSKIEGVNTEIMSIREGLVGRRFTK